MAPQPPTEEHAARRFPFSLDNKAAVKAAASVIGRTNHSRGGAPVLSRPREEEEGRGGGQSFREMAPGTEAPRLNLIRSLSAATASELLLGHIYDSARHPDLAPVWFCRCVLCPLCGT